MKLLQAALILLASLFAAALPLAAQEPSAEAAAFLKARAPDASLRMTRAVRDAIAGNPAVLKEYRESQDVPPPEGVRVLESKEDGLRIHTYRPGASQSDAVVLYFHGGGWTIGCLEGSSRFCGDLAKATNLDVATMDYRLAPEFKAPAALEDALKGIEALRRRGYRRIYLSGDSAGGNLAAASALKLRSQIAGIVLYYPVVLAGNDASASWKSFGRGFGLDGALMDAFNEAYAPGALADDPLVSPLAAKEFDGYPKTLLVAAECDILCDQGAKFARILKENGVSAERVVMPGALHAFMTYPNMENAYRNGLRLAAEFIDNAEKESKMQGLGPDAIVRLSKIEVDPARLREYVALATECGRTSMEREPGVLMMYSMMEKDAPGKVTILEIYADQATYEKHIRSEHFQKYKRETLDMVRKLELVDQVPLTPDMRMKDPARRSACGEKNENK